MPDKQPGLLHGVHRMHIQQINATDVEVFTTSSLCWKTAWRHSTLTTVFLTFTSVFSQKIRSWIAQKNCSLSPPSYTLPCRLPGPWAVHLPACALSKVLKTNSFHWAKAHKHSRHHPPPQSLCLSAPSVSNWDAGWANRVFLPQAKLPGVYHCLEYIFLKVYV